MLYLYWNIIILLNCAFSERKKRIWGTGYLQFSVRRVCLAWADAAAAAMQRAIFWKCWRHVPKASAATKKIDKAWFERILAETGKTARFYPMYLKVSSKDCPKLQPMDSRILACLADGLSIQETAIKLNMKYETLRSRIKEIYRKLGAKNKTEAVMTARSLKLIWMLRSRWLSFCVYDHTALYFCHASKETLIKTKSPRSNAHTHAADFVTLRFNQRIPNISCWTTSYFYVFLKNLLIFPENMV